MAEPDITLGVGDTAPVFRATLNDPAGDPVDLTGATVTMKIRDVNHVAASRTVSVTILDETDAEVGYDWVTADTETAGDYHMRIEALLASGKVMSWPNDRSWVLRVTPDP